ncbi:phage integrase family protein [Methanobrevibacter cuticularis]|uniref:Phage integrase family protein n=1 Tax=Methanobrevibacter cuticularis TaxID=47311 RepID=A0A166EJA9_9EURY|nr:tyrosine-type recombinase/integrase [Methanobrevibacter cuticularis]KZX16718.1 phage integrase family protein [Methanobrevibacter cuticularis]
MKFSETDIKLMQLIQRRNLGKASIRKYNIVFREIYELIGKTPSQLIAEAKKEEQPFNNENGIPQILDLSERKVNSYQLLYNNFLKSKGNSEGVRKHKIVYFRALFKEYDIKLPKMIKYNTSIRRTRIKDIPSWDDVKKSLDFCKSIRDKALVLLIATSGMRGGDIVSLTIQDFLEATSIYKHKSKLDKLLSKNPYEIIPCYDFFPEKTKKEGNLCITFNTGECSYFIFEHLKERIKEGCTVELESPLFISNGSSSDFISADWLRRILKTLNATLNLGKDKNGLYGKFRGHNLRKLFSTTCRQNITNVVVKADKYSELDVVSIFTGHAPPNMSNSDVYDAVDSEDSFDSYLRKNYEALIPYLTIDKTQFLVEEENKDFENEIMKIKNSVDVLLNNKEQLTS